MLRHVSIFVHHVEFPSTALSLDLDAIRRLYFTAGIDVELDEDEDIPFDPPLDPSSPYLRYVQRYAVTADRGHLIIGRRCPRPESEIAGELIDLDRRGVGAVYTESPYIRDHGNLGLLQSAAHEIGHMLNLPDEQSIGLMSTMNQAKDRKSGSPTTAWIAASDEAREERRHGREPFFFPLTQANDCFPLTLPQRKRLNGMSDLQMLPWRGKYEHDLET